MSKASRPQLANRGKAQDLTQGLFCSPGPTQSNMRHMSKPAQAGCSQSADRSESEIRIRARSMDAPTLQGGGDHCCLQQDIEPTENLPGAVDRQRGVRANSPAISSSRPRVARRLHAATREPHATAFPDSHTRLLQARVRTGVVRFFLKRVGCGLYVEREDLPRRGRPTMQILDFAEPAAFQRWCDGDSVRFEDPQVYVGLQREADTLWQIESVHRG